MKIVKCWKVVSVYGNKFYSLIHKSIGPEFKVGEWVEPIVAGSSIMCCRSLQYANFWHNNTSTKLFECEIIEEKYPFFVSMGNTSTSLVIDKLNKYLLLKKQHKSTKGFNEIRFASSEAIFAKKVKLTKEVYSPCLF